MLQLRGSGTQLIFSIIVESRETQSLYKMTQLKNGIKSPIKPAQRVAGSTLDVW